MRRFTSLLIACFVLYGFTVWAMNRLESAWAPALKLQIETVAQRNLGVPVSVERLRYQFPLGLRLIHVDAGPLFQAQEIQAHLGFLNLPTALLHGNKAECLRHIILIEPRLHASTVDINRFKTRPRTKQTPFAPTFFSVIIEKGTLEWSLAAAPLHPLELQHVDASFTWRGPQQSFSLDATSALAGNVHAGYSAFGKRWKSELKLEGLNVDPTVAWIDTFKEKPLLSKNSRLEGLLDISLKAAGHNVPHSAHDLLHAVSSVRYEVTHGKLSLENDRIPWTLQGALTQANNAFVIEKGRFHLGEFSGTLSGVVTPFADTPDFQIQARSKPHTDIDTLLRLIHCPRILEGSGDVIVHATGPFHDPHLTVQFSLPEGRLWERPIENVTALARYNAAAQWELLDAGFHFGKTGVVQVNGTLSKDEPALHATVEGVSLKELAPTLTGDGLLSGGLTLDGPWDDWQLRGSWWATHVLWKEKSIGADWRGDVEVDRAGTISVSGGSTDGHLHAQAHALFDKSRITLDNAVVELSNNEKIRAQGSFRPKLHTADFSVVSDHLSAGHQTLRHIHVQGIWAQEILALRVELETHADSDKDPTPAILSGALHFKPHHITADHLHYVRHNLTIDGQATAIPVGAWVPFEGKADVKIKGSQTTTTIPLLFKGHLETDHHSRGGADITSGPLRAALSWDQLNEILIKAELKPGEWNTSTLHLNIDGDWKLAEPSTFTVHGTMAPDAQLNGAMTLNGRHLVIEDGSFRTKESRLEFLPGGSIDFPAEGDLQTHASLKLRNIHIGVLTLFGSLDMDGKWTRDQDHSLIAVQARTHSLFINDYELEEGQILADWENGVLHFASPAHAPSLLNGSVNFQKKPQLLFDHLQITGKEGQKLEINGEMGPALWNYALVGEGLDLAALGELSGLPVSMSGTAHLTIKAKGDETHPNVEGHARIQSGSIANVQYENGETDFIWQGDRITFQNLRLQDSHRYTAIGEGVFPIQNGNMAPSALPEINFSVRLQDTNLGLLQSMFPEIKSARGAVDGLVQIRGTLQEPLYRGHLTVTDGQVANAHYFHKLDDIQVSVNFDRDQLHIENIHFHSGKGELRVHGDMGLAGVTPTTFNLSADTLTNAPLEVDVPELAIPDSPLANRFKFLTTVSRVNVQGHVQLTGTDESPVFRGDVTISDGHFTFPPSAKKSQSSALTAWARRIYWDLNLHFKDQAWFENELVEANINGGFKIKGTADALGVDGGLTIPKGKISYLGLQFDIREARFDMKSSAPFLSGEASSQVQATDTVGLTGGVNTAQRFSVEDTITLTIPYGPLDQIKPRLTSATDPGLSQEKVIARVTQMDVENLTPEERNYLYQQQAISLIDNSLTTPLAQKVLKRTGIADRFRAEHVFDPNSAPPVDPITGQPVRGTTAADLFANTKYTVEKDLLGNLSLGYGVRFVPTTTADPNARRLDLVSDVEMSYHAFKNVYVRANYDLPNSNPSIIPDKRVTIEPRWRFGWWGNTNKPKPTPAQAADKQP